MSLVVDFADYGAALTLPPSNYTTAMGGAALLADPATPFSQLPAPLQGMGTRMVYLDPANNMHNIAGTNAGLEGTRVCTQVFGDQQWPFEQVLVNSPYIFGAQIMRQNIPERRFNFGVVIGSHAPPMTEWQYREAEDYWWAGQDESNDGWLGVYTRFSGWRWIPVRPDETVKTPQQLDSTAYGNNASRWDITWIAQRPYFTKPARYLTFQAATAGTPQPAPSDLDTNVTPALAASEYYWGQLPIANAGDLPSYVTYYVSSPGQAVVQDNSSTRLVPLPDTVESVGTYMCDSEPGQRTLTAANDPQSNLVFDLIAQSEILDYFLSGVTSGSTPLQLQFQNRFIYSVPPQTATTFTVGHSDPAGVIVAMLPQRYKRSR
jgi:hypothetical protein